MMSLIFIFLFLTPLCLGSSYLLIQFFLLLSYLYLLYFGCFSHFMKISYLLGLDSFSYSFILLTLLVSSMMAVSMIGCSNMNLFMLVNVFLVVFLYIIFSTLDFFYMYISFEFILVPLMILILGWGYQPERLISGLYLFFYTLLVSLPLFFLLVVFYMSTGSMFFDYISFQSDFFVIHLILMVVFMVKFPMCFFHYWLPKAHVQAPVSGSMILAGLMLKIGGYGLIRSMNLCEYMYMYYSCVWFSISLVGSVLISIVCLLQSDIKCLIAYSSVCHMGMVIMGLMSMKLWGIVGSLYLMLGHGFCSSGLFYISNLFYSRSGSRSFYINKGLMNYMPSCAMFLFLLCSFNMGCPPSLNFLSEVMILMSMINYWMISLFFFIVVSFMCACFSFYLYSFSQHGLNSTLYSFSSLTVLEMLCLQMHLIPLLLYPLFVSSLF